MRNTLVLTLCLLTGCAGQPVKWGAIVYEGAPQEPSDFPGPLSGQPSETACPGSLRVANAGKIEYAAWWTSRRDSSAVLMTARRSGRGRWSEPVAADSTDHSVRGCGRPPPAIAADSASGYVHLAYFSEPKNGAGIFFAHSMDSGATFHSPVPVVFGRNPSRVSVASAGDRVAVAYEDPNSAQPIISIALSKTMGHIFESRRSMVSSENGMARQPVVRIGADSIRVWWSEYSLNPAVSATRPLYRSGIWKN